MTNNGNEPASPVLLEGASYSAGLTKRELFAAMAMQGLLSCYTDVGGPDEQIVGWSVRYADALLAELAKETTDGD